MRLTNKQKKYIIEWLDILNTAHEHGTPPGILEAIRSWFYEAILDNQDSDITLGALQEAVYEDLSEMVCKELGEIKDALMRI